MSTLWRSDPGTLPIELVTVAPVASPAAPAEFRPRIAVVTLHDGDFIPADLLEAPGVARLADDGRLAHGLTQARDWGANLVARHLVAHLGVEGYHRVNVARVAMDFNRFPGVSPAHAGPLDRLALSGEFADGLDHTLKRRLLESCYDAISESLEEAIRDKLLLLSIHTYDERNPSDTQRPELSLLSRSDSYQQHSRLPFGLFDPLFPDVLVESSAKRILRDRVALTLEKAGIYVEHNYPYCLPDGSVEIRSQPWFFFQHVRRLYEAERPHSQADSAHRLVWDTLLNTNLRRADAGALFGYLHRDREAPPGRAAEFERARAVYEDLARWLRAHETLITEYRFSDERTSAISIEVRKDLVWNFDDRGLPVGPNAARAQAISQIVAESIGVYFREDR